MKKTDVAEMNIEKIEPDKLLSSKHFDLEHLCREASSIKLMNISPNISLRAKKKLRKLWELHKKPCSLEKIITASHTEMHDEKIAVKVVSKAKPQKGQLLKATQQLAAQDRGALASMVMNLFDHWNLSTEDQASLLGLATSNRAALTRYRKGEPVGTSRDQYERVGHLLAIHRNLRALFPENRELVYKWMSLRNRAFDNLTPVEVIREKGFAGLLMVRSYLDRALVS